MENVINPIQTLDEFISMLFINPNDIRVKKSTFKRIVKDDDDYFYMVTLSMLNEMDIKEKKFKKIVGIDDHIRQFLKLLAPQNKQDLQLRPQLANIFYDAENNQIVGTDAHVLYVWGYFRNLKDYLGYENLYLNVDIYGNITRTKESEAVYKYPKYVNIIPTIDANDEIYHISNYHINVLFHLVKCGKLIGLNLIRVKIGPAVFDAFKLVRLISAFKTDEINYNFNLHISSPNRAAYVHTNQGYHIGLVMPITFDQDTKFFDLLNYKS